MSYQITLGSWQVALDWQGMTLTPATRQQTTTARPVTRKQNVEPARAALQRHQTQATPRLATARVARRIS